MAERLSQKMVTEQNILILFCPITIRGVVIKLYKK